MDQTKILTFISELRKSLLHLGIALVAGTAALYFLSPFILHHMQDHLHQNLAFFRVAEPFIAHIKLAFLSAVFLLIPWLATVSLRAATTPFGLSRRNRLLFTVFACVLFYTGTLFCYFVTMPFGVRFLLSYQSKELQPVISIGRFVNFVTGFLLGFGVIFELPLIMVLVAKAGICPRSFFERNRRYAILLAFIIGAILTPPDAMTQCLMAVPLCLLYELGIVLLRVMKIC